MKFKTKNEAVSSIIVRRRTVNGVVYPIYEVYLGVNAITRKQERLYAASEKRLIALINEYYKGRDRIGDLSSVLTAEQVMDAKAALKVLEDAGSKLTLLECAKRELARTDGDAESSVRLGDAYDDFVDSKSLNSEAELKKTESTTGKWVYAVGRDAKVSSITTQDILEYLKTNYETSKPRTYNAHLSYIRTFLNWCASKSQGYIRENPASDIQQKPVQWEEPKFLSTDDCRKLLTALWKVRDEHPEYLALTVNGLCMGIRREESKRMAEDPTSITVNLEDETVRISKPKGYTKGIMPRAFNMTPMSVAWAKCFDYKRGVALINEYTSSAITDLAESIGIDLPKNAYRHTFITKHVAAYGEPEKTQAMVGTSAQMRANNYCGLDSKKEGLAFFGIMPPAK